MPGPRRRGAQHRTVWQRDPAAERAVLLPVTGGPEGENAAPRSRRDDRRGHRGPRRGSAPRGDARASCQPWVRATSAGQGEVGRREMGAGVEGRGRRFARPARGSPARRSAASSASRRATSAIPRASTRCDGRRRPGNRGPPRQGAPDDRGGEPGQAGGKPTPAAGPLAELVDDRRGARGDRLVGEEAAQIVRERRSALVTLGRLEGQRLAEDGLEIPAEIAAHAREREGGHLADDPQHLEQLLAGDLVGETPGQELEADDAERVDSERRSSSPASNEVCSGLM